jgi:hypothetical protein
MIDLVAREFTVDVHASKPNCARADPERMSWNLGDVVGVPITVDSPVRGM